jgi:environmental stress-induced protein Ves
MRLVRTSDYRRMPWKNGSGVTAEIVVSPDGTSLDAFDWRISTAKVASDGPFSSFPAVDRTLCIVEGKGIDLTFPGRTTVHLDRNSLPFTFPADVPVAAELVDGAIEDLNVMTRRSRFRHHVWRLRTAVPAMVPRLGEIVALLVRGAGAELRTPEVVLRAEDGDAVLLDPMGTATVEIRPDAALELYIVDIWGSEKAPVGLIRGSKAPAELVVKR